MIINVELNTKKELLWSLPGTKLMLTSDNTKAAIELDELDNKQKWSIAVSVLAGRISCDTEPNKIYQQVVAPTLPLPPNQGQIVEVDKQPMSSDQLAMRAKELLSGVASEIRKELLVTKDTRLIKMMLVLEEARTLKRAGVIKAIKDKLNLIEKSVKQSVESDVNAISQELPVDPSMSPRGSQQINYSVIESNEDIKVIDIPIPIKSATV